MNTPKTTRKSSTNREQDLHSLIKMNSPASIIKEARDSLNLLDKMKLPDKLKLPKSSNINR